jgi:Fe-S-cluster containining protein
MRQPHGEDEMPKTDDPKSVLSQWLTDYNEASWRRYVANLKSHGDLVLIDGIMVDAPAVFRTRFRCDSTMCAGVGRPEKTDSCCMEYEVEITPKERERIEAHSADVLAYLRRQEPRRIGGRRSLKTFFDDDHTVVLKKEEGRCAFSYRDENNKLWCGLHSMALERGMPIESIKPMACILFPLVVYRFENDDILLTATSRATGRLFDGLKDWELLPCLKLSSGPRMYEECKPAIEIALGSAFYQRLASSAATYLGNGRGAARA